MPTIGMTPSDGGNDGALLDLTNGAILYVLTKGSPFNSTAQADRFPTGLFAIGNNDGTNGPLTIWQWNAATLFTKVATVGAPAGITSLWPAVRQSGANIWAVDTSASLNTPTFRKIDQTGAVLKSSGPITSIPNGVAAIVPNAAETIMYYHSGVAGTAIKRWDLTNNLGLSNLVTPVDGVVANALFAIPSSSDIAAITQTAYSGTVPVNEKIIRYTAVGAVVYTVDFYDIPAAFTDTTIEIALDPSLTSVWVRTPSAPLYSQTVSSIYLNIDLLLGGTKSSVTIPVNAAGAPAATCPFLILGVNAGGTPCGSFT